MESYFNEIHDLFNTFILNPQYSVYLFIVGVFLLGIITYLFSFKTPQPVFEIETHNKRKSRKQKSSSQQSKLSKKLDSKSAVKVPIQTVEIDQEEGKFDIVNVKRTKVATDDQVAPATVLESDQEGPWVPIKTKKNLVAIPARRTSPDTKVVLEYPVEEVDEVKEEVKIEVKEEVKIEIKEEENTELKEDEPIVQEPEEEVQEDEPEEQVDSVAHTESPVASSSDDFELVDLIRHSSREEEIDQPEEESLTKATSGASRKKLKKQQKLISQQLMEAAAATVAQETPQQLQEEEEASQKWSSVVRKQPPQKSSAKKRRPRKED